MKNSGIYLIRNTVTGKVYVGSSVDIKARWIRHRAMLRGNRHHSSKLQNSWNKHGKNAFKFEVIEPVANVLHLTAIEQTFLDYHKAVECGYNICTCTNSVLGRKHTDKTRAKMSASRAGIVLSEESRAKISKTLTGHAISTDTREKISKTLTGRVVPKEECAKMSEAQQRMAQSCRAYFFSTSRNRWIARLPHQGKKLQLGSFLTEEEAIERVKQHRDSLIPIIQPEVE
jgi:group I intron endonuclease